MTSCEKDWLEEKPKQSLATPNTIKDLENLLENTSLFNENYSCLGEEGTNDYYFNSSELLSLSINYQNGYTWSNSQDFYGGSPMSVDWNKPYNLIFVANNILEQHHKIIPRPEEQERYNTVKARALYFRAFSYFNLAQHFCKAYLASTAPSELGLILRLESDINLPSSRASIQATFDQIINDLEASKSLLPIDSKYPTQPNKKAAFAMLARVYLYMGKYDQAFINADSCLKYFNRLIDYNTIDASSLFPFGETYSDETIFYSQLAPTSLTPTLAGYGIVDSTLHNSYENNDLRKNVFFAQSGDKLIFKGGYALFMFNGLASDELYLIRAECSTRKNDIQSALDDVNTLRAKRWLNSIPYSPVSITDKTELLHFIIEERHKELCFRGLRWYDLKRLNLQPGFETVLTRGILGENTIYTLPPNDNRYVYPIPPTEINLSGVQQNPR
jgi:hypothetical protein